MEHETGDLMKIWIGIVTRLGMKPENRARYVDQNDQLADMVL